MSGHKKSLLRRKLGVAPLPVAVLAALVAGSATLVIWQSPRNIVADVQPLIMDFGKSKVQSSNDLRPQANESVSPDDEAASSKTDDSGTHRSASEPVRTQRSNGGLVLEWPTRKSKKAEAESTDAKTQAKKILDEAENYLLVGDLRRALTSARLAYSYPVKWDDDEQSPEELLAKLEALTSDPTFVASACQNAINKINSANNSSQSHSQADNIVNSIPDRQTAIGIWKPASDDAGGSFASSVDSQSGESNSNNVSLAGGSESDGGISKIETVSATQITEPQFPAYQPYESEPSTSGAADDEPRRLSVDTHRQISESTAEFAAPAQVAPINQIEPRPLIITDQRAAAPAASPIGTLTFDVLATLTTIFAVLFFGSLFLFLALLAIGKKLVGEKGVAFRIELVNNSPLTIQAAGVAPTAAAPQAAAPATDELKIDPDFEGILSLSEQRARQREAAILEQFIENNVSLHNEIGAGRAAA